MDAGVDGRIVPKQLGRLIRRGVIADDKLIVAIILTQHRLDRLGKIASVVVRGN
jgi:hypothetical protein